jgi:hypothetical protein
MRRGSARSPVGLRSTQNSRQCWQPHRCSLYANLPEKRVRRTALKVKNNILLEGNSRLLRRVLRSSPTHRKHLANEGAGGCRPGQGCSRLGWVPAIVRADYHKRTSATDKQFETRREHDESCDHCDSKCAIAAPRAIVVRPLGIVGDSPELAP